MSICFAGDCHLFLCVSHDASAAAEHLLRRVHPADLQRHVSAGKQTWPNAHAKVAGSQKGAFKRLFSVLQIFWYRQGNLEPKFRNLIYFMLASIVLLCICANLYFHDVR